MEEEEVRLIQVGNYTFKLLKRPDGTYKSEPLPLPPPKEEEKGIPLVPEEERTLGIFESQSKPGDKHYVRITPKGTIYCTCWGFRSPDKCWHYRGMMEVLKEIPIEQITEPLIIDMEVKQ